MIIYILLLLLLLSLICVYIYSYNTFLAFLFERFTVASQRALLFCAGHRWWCWHASCWRLCAARKTGSRQKISEDLGMDSAEFHHGNTWLHVYTVHIYRHIYIYVYIYIYIYIHTYTWGSISHPIQCRVVQIGSPTEGGVDQQMATTHSPGHGMPCWWLQIATVDG